MVVTPSVGELIRNWRMRRRFTQTDLADAAGIPVKVLGQIETGRAGASRDLLLRLAEHLDIPLRERNPLLTAAGYAPSYPDRSLEHPALDAAREGLHALLAAQAPCPAVVMDRGWTLVAANQAFHRLVAGADPLLLRSPVNVLRLWLHPAGLAPRIANLREWRELMVRRLRRSVVEADDSRLSDLLEEVQDYPLPRGATLLGPGKGFDLPVQPLRLVTIEGTLTLASVVSRFETATDITLAELTIETFLPMDQETTTILRQMSDPTAAEGAIRPFRLPTHRAVAG